MTTNRKRNLITVYEHQKLKVGEQYGDVEFKLSHLESLEQFYGNGVPYFSLIHRGVQFNEHVGVLQVGKLTIEVLPKADKYQEQNDWRNILIGMMQAVNAFQIQAPSSSSLQLKSNFILDLYFELFLQEVEYLFNKGLIKKYRKVERNGFALKGNILFGKHIQKNIVHKERFYTRQSTYDKIHLLHQIIYKALLLLQRVNTNVLLKSRIGSLLLDFPEMKNIQVNESTFSKFNYNRKSEPYKNAIEIARLLLLNYHPDLSKGSNHVLALMFDMNMLWERFIYVSLRKELKEGMSISAQSSKNFWQSKDGSNSTIRPDIVIELDDKEKVVLDTKWKNIGNSNPSSDDLRQLYVYHQYYGAKKVALVYPGKNEVNRGNYYKFTEEELSDQECSVIKIPPNITISDWQHAITQQLLGDWLNIEGIT